MPSTQREVKQLSARHGVMIGRMISAFGADDVVGSRQEVQKTTFSDDRQHVTLALFQPGRKTGIVIFTDGPDIGHQIIDKILGILYPNRIYRNTLW
jgi:hypothetical protein